MNRFQKIVALDRTGLNRWGEQACQALAETCVFYQDIPQTDQEKIRRLQDADALLVSYRTPVSGDVLRRCKKLRYIGLCCSLYSPESCNVDLAAAKELGLTVTGIFDYGDEGVIEYELAALIQLLHGFGGEIWKGSPRELGGLQVGIIGLGTVGIKLARALKFFGSELYYYSRTRKPEVEAELGITYLALPPLLETCDVVSTHLPRNTYLLDDTLFSHFSGGKILINTSLGPTFELQAIKKWLKQDPNNRYLCDKCGMGLDLSLEGVPGVLYTGRGSGASIQSTQRLNEKVIANAKAFLKTEPLL